jgi:hypothetical protein
MSRLDSFIRRLTAQRDILNLLASDGSLPAFGAILEIGLGNGRTYSHLRSLFPDRRIIAFDRALGAHAASTPDKGDLVLGEIAETARAYAGGNAALVHADIGTGYPEKDSQTLMWLPQLVTSLLGPGGIAVSGLPLVDTQLAPMPGLPGIESNRYFLYRKNA